MNFDIEARGPIGPGARRFSRFLLEQAVVLGFEAWWTGKHALIVEEHFAPDAVLVNHCPAHLSAFGGVHHGCAAINRGFRIFTSEFLVSDPCVTSILTDGFHVAVSYSVLLRHVGTGRAGRVAGMAHVTVDPESRIKKIDNFFDSACFAEVGEMLEDFAVRSEAMDRARRASLAAAQEIVPRSL